jgi:hypothetical protein
MDSKLAGFIAGRGYDSPVVWLPANCKRQSYIFRMMKKVNIHKESIHVKVEYRLGPSL